jgi:hypothetical protein
MHGVLPLHVPLITLLLGLWLAGVCPCTFEWERDNHNWADFCEISVKPSPEAWPPAANADAAAKIAIRNFERNHPLVCTPWPNMPLSFDPSLLHLQQHQAYVAYLSHSTDVPSVILLCREPGIAGCSFFPGTSCVKAGVCTMRLQLSETYASSFFCCQIHAVLWGKEGPFRPSHSCAKQIRMRDGYHYGL